MRSSSLRNTAVKMEYATREAREATFVPPTKRSKTGWPHKTPTAADLSRAGFYYKPSPHSNDNTACFLCDRNLDGWEENDDPVQEHVKHAEDCGWAVMMSLETAPDYDASSMEDPTAQRLSVARKATFAVGWPHDEKRGWTCKTDKMVEAGWYFAPTSGSEDYVSCVYCKLSLDGWEPKDNPFEEHYSRSPSCPFFVFAGTTAPSKRPKAKKGRASRASRTSKVSRLSTQSNMTTQSEILSIPDLDQSIDNSVMSVSSTVSTATTKGKRKAGTARSKSTKAKRTKTTKPKRTEASDAETTALEQSHTGQVPYLQLDIEQVQQAENSQKDLDEEATNPVALRESTPEQPTGPPELPTPTIPISLESPVPIHSHSRPTRASLKRSISKADIKATTPEARSSPSQPSDVENAPPSARPESVRPPLSSPGVSPPQWSAIDVDVILNSISRVVQGEVVVGKNMTDSEKQMTVQEWIKHIAEKAEIELRAEGERVVSVFEKEGQRALTVLEGVVCV